MITLYLEQPKVRLMLSVILLVFVVQMAHSQELSIGNTSSNIGSGRYKWTVYVEADNSVLSKIDHVEYRLPQEPYGAKALRKVSTPRTGKYPFSTTDAAFEPFSIGVTIAWKDGKWQKLPDYLLTFSGSIISPGGVAITQVIKLKQKNSINITVPEFKGALSVYVDDIHDPFKKKPFYIKVSIGGAAVKEGRLYSGPSVSLPFSYGGHEYVLTGYTKTGVFDDNLIFKVYRKK